MAYWEIKIVESGPFCIGVAAKRKEELDKPLTDRGRTWCMNVLENQFEVGDIIGCSYDMSGVKSMLRFYLNGSAHTRLCLGVGCPSVELLL